MPGFRSSRIHPIVVCSWGCQARSETVRLLRPYEQGVTSTPIRRCGAGCQPANEAAGWQPAPTCRKRRTVSERALTTATIENRGCFAACLPGINAGPTTAYGGKEPKGPSL